MRLLVVEDEPRMAALLRRGLAEEGFVVDVAPDADEALWYAAECRFDAVLLDVGLPGLDGFSVLESLRRDGCWVPVLMLTARDAVPDRVRGLDLGADDYLVKPFAFDELLARVRALVRRAPPVRPAVLVVDDLTLDPARHLVCRAGVQIALTAKEFALLECFMRRADRVVSRAELVENVWDAAFDGDSNVVDVYVGYLRQKVDRPFGRHSLQTVRGYGYRLAAVGTGGAAGAAGAASTGRRPGEGGRALV
jgi:two-component system OmpR family response regulator